jgi:hypothetical protein
MGPVAGVCNLGVEFNSLNDFSHKEKLLCKLFSKIQNKNLAGKIYFAKE